MSEAAKDGWGKRGWTLFTWSRLTKLVLEPQLKSPWFAHSQAALGPSARTPRELFPGGHSLGTAIPGGGSHPRVPLPGEAGPRRPLWEQEPRGGEERGGVSGAVPVPPPCSYPAWGGWGAGPCPWTGRTHRASRGAGPAAPPWGCGRGRRAAPGALANTCRPPGSGGEWWL